MLQHTDVKDERMLALCREVDTVPEENQDGKSAHSHRRCSFYYYTVTLLHAGTYCYTLHQRCCILFRTAAYNCTLLHIALLYIHVHVHVRLHSHTLLHVYMYAMLQLLLNIFVHLM